MAGKDAGQGFGKNGVSGQPVETVGAVLLAAGAGARMGHRPKSLLMLEGRPLILRQLVALSQAGIDDVVVVLGHHAARIEEVLGGCPVKRVHNPDPDLGHTSSLRLGLQAISPKRDAVLVALADQPLINAQDIRDLLNAYAQRPFGMQVVQPMVEGLPGNPVMFSRTVHEDILASDARVGCRQWQLAHPGQVYAWPCTNPHYRTDVDTPQDIEAFGVATGCKLHWPEDSP